MTDPQCEAATDCNGVAVAQGRCVGHLDEADLSTYIGGLAVNEPVDARRAAIDASHCRILARLLTDVGRECYFGQATFTESADFAGATLDANFFAATFTQDADFTGARFTDAHFWTATFSGTAKFGQAMFGGNTDFGRARFIFAEFTGATFTGPADFSKATFWGHANLDQVTFARLADFHEATFRSMPTFHQATFSGDADFSWATFSPGVSFSRATFNSRCQLGPLRSGHLTLDDARFDGPVTIQARCQKLDAIGIRCRERLSLAARTGMILLTGARFDGPATIAASGDSISFPPPTFDDGEERYEQDDWEQGGPPRLRSVEATDLSNVTVAGLDLTECSFTGAYNLDKLHIDGPPNFATQPPGWWSRRMVLADECYWRARYDRRPNGWREQYAARFGDPPRYRRWASRDFPSREEAERVQAAYRELRKSREDAKDEPGAADFYYGEMEMRRMATQASPRPSGEPPNRFENALLTAYWAVSGYGLRASRAFSALLLVLALATVGFATVGFARAHDTVYVPAVSSTTANQPVPYKQSSVTTDKPGIRDAAYYSVESATSLLREPTTEPLTTSGRIFEITLRLLGPLLLGLALLALRGRVKR